jgi:hypothetical protein
MPAPSPGVFVGCDQPLAACHSGRGKEAAPLRRGLLFIVVVAAAFGGGVIASGSRPEWGQAALKLLPRNSVSVDTLSSATVAPTEDGDPSSTSSHSIPSAPVPPLVVGPVPEEPSQPSSSTPSSEQASPPPSTSSADHSLRAASIPPLEQAPIAGTDAATIQDASGQATGLKAPSASATPSLETGPSPTPTNSRVATASGSAGARELASTKEHGWADVPGSAPAAAVLPGIAQSRPERPATLPVGPVVSAPPMRGPETGSGESSASTAQAWIAVRHRMRELGVARYWLEGEPDGPVRFRCVIPLAGRRAVGQQFEAEGDDDLQAAEAALRRVALWKATEVP